MGSWKHSQERSSGYDPGWDQWWGPPATDTLGTEGPLQLSGITQSPHPQPSLVVDRRECQGGNGLHGPTATGSHTYSPETRGPGRFPGPWDSLSDLEDMGPSLHLPSQPTRL